jgi:hypothetical protein
VSTAEGGEPVRRLHPRVDRHAAVQREVDRLVAQRVDVRARVLGHDEQRRRARAGLAEPGLVPAVEVEDQSRLVRGEHRRAGVARLLEVVRARRAQRVDEVHQSGESSAPCVSGSSASEAMAST